MGRELYHSEPAARAIFDAADEHLDFPLSELCFHGPEEQLTDTANQQPALFVTSIATWRAAEVRGWTSPDYVAGHSLGEFSALVAAGSVNFADGLTLVRKRGQLMKDAGERAPGAMAAILALSVELVEEICAQAQEETAHPVQVANDNCPGQVVISGSKEGLERALTLAAGAGARKVVPLPITIAAHSVLMLPASTEFSRVVDDTRITAPRIPIIGNVSARPLTTPEEIRSELKSQLVSPVRWTDSMRYLIHQDVETFIELGPGDVLLGLLKRLDRSVKRVKLSDE